MGILLALPIAARDFDYTYEGKTITYTVLDEEAKTVSTKAGYYSYGYVPGNNISGDLVIPTQVSDGSNVYTVTEIGKFAFSDCNALTKVVIPNSVTSIDEYAFYGCSGLTSVEIPNSVNVIGEHAFRNCDCLTSIVITNSVNYIDGSVFSDCNSLESIDVDEENKYYRSIDGVLFNFDTTDLLQYPAGKVGHYNIPNSVATIGAHAFSGCRGLTSVFIGNSVSKVGYSAFFNCNALTKAEFASLESLCKINFDFSYSNPLVCAHHLYINGEEIIDLVIPDGVKTLNGTFEGCDFLKSVVMPNTVSNLIKFAFWGCTGLTSVELPNSVTNIGYGTFGNCFNLKDIEIPNSVTTISLDAFVNCHSLTSVEIPNSVTTIGLEAFKSCSSLTSIVIPNSVNFIGWDAFANCI